MSLYLSNENQEALLEWARDRIGFPGTWPVGARALGVLDADADDRVRATLVTVQTYEGIIDAHLASDGSRRWATRNILGGFFGYMFFFREARRVQTVIDPENTDSVFMVYKMGFTFEGRVAASLDNGKDGVLLGMTPESCKWIVEDKDG